ncbi:hypothetical protein GHT06_010932 [Daphnia sinensis]|uniref:Chitin-binding type-2 domain-containing protein n=1 Tax=Daphnia sinensis TaxID=1820382 RepID=A0AAD5L1D7_9CRUS|nr:hypothetical protein GHT06_010932 [Daphnia sinensis]
MAVSFRLSTLCFFFALVALALSSKTSSKEELDHSSSKEDTSSSKEDSSSSKEDSSSSKEDVPSGELQSEEDTTCEDDLTTAPPPPEPTTTKPIITVAPEPFDCKSKTNGNYVNPADCTTYIACSNGYTYIMPCPANLVYNEKGWCDYVYNVPRCM